MKVIKGISETDPAVKFVGLQNGFPYAFRPQNIYKFPARVLFESEDVDELENMCAKFNKQRREFTFEIVDRDEYDTYLEIELQNIEEAKARRKRG